MECFSGNGEKNLPDTQNIKGGMRLYGGCSCISWIMCTVYDVLSVVF